MPTVGSGCDTSFCRPRHRSEARTYPVKVLRMPQRRCSACGGAPRHCWGAQPWAFSSRISLAELMNNAIGC